MDNVEQNIENLNKYIDLLIEFGVTYGFQILGALAFFAFGFLVINWIGNRLQKIAIAKNIDETLSGFMASSLKLVMMVMLIIITLGNFGISIAPLIALAGAVTLGATMALQGPISNFGSGVAIILTRPYVVGNVVTVRGVSGIVDKVTLGTTFLLGEDGEKIAIPNKEIVGQILVNSNENRILELQFSVSSKTDTELLAEKITALLKTFPEIREDPTPQVGIHDFALGGVVMGVRAWIPGNCYFRIRYSVNDAILTLLKSEKIKLLAPVFNTGEE
ncbi:mechanosensitive ion channel family protein [Sneathiella aquimaris]|uniref:mechanosensitive ion channel family protein n=1 Tax=Sneathiella aquimaris TaxID=2599305 RepID=UPI00146AE5B0|nr:mechanosensitive ion channel family protein [Sneathiella aquimaris]